MTEEPLTESDAITGTKTALVLDLADGRTVELTAHVASARDSGLRGLDEFEPDEKPDSQRCYSAGPATLVLRDVVAEEDDPIGLLPVYDLDVDVDVPDDWERLDPEKVAGKIGDPSIMNPVFEHSSGEAWLVVTKKLETYAGGPNGGGTYPVFDVYIEGGTPSLGIHKLRSQTFQPDPYSDDSELENVVEAFLAEYDHTVPEDGGSA